MGSMVMSTIDTRPRIDFLTYDRTIGLSTMQGRGFYYPTDTHIAADGTMFVVSRSLESDIRGVRVTVTNLESEYFGTFAGYGDGDGEYIWPTAITADSDGRLYISDELNQRITVSDSSGKFLAKWGVHGSGPGELDGPSGLAFDSDDNLYVVDHHNHRVQKFTKDGESLLAFGSEGVDNGQFNLPWGLTVDARGEVYVADWGNDSIQRFSPGGEFLARYGGSGRGDGQFARPADVAVDDEGYIYVADWGNERVQVLDPEGGFVTKLRGEATLSKWAEEYFEINTQEAEARGKSDLVPEMEFFIDDPHEESSHIEKYFWAPTSIKLDGAGRIYVTESNRHRIQVYQRS